MKDLTKIFKSGNDFQFKNIDYKSKRQSKSFDKLKKQLQRIKRIGIYSNASDIMFDA